MSFNIPNITKVRNNSCFINLSSGHSSTDEELITVHHLFNTEELKTIDYDVVTWINRINTSIRYGDNMSDKLKRTGWRLNSNYQELLNHPIFKKYLNALVKAGYCIKIAQLPEPCINIYWDVKRLPKLIYLQDNDQEWDDDYKNYYSSKKSYTDYNFDSKLIGGVLISVILLTYFVSRR